MKKILIWILFLSSVNAYGLEWKEVINDIWGDVFTTLNIDAGSLAVHNLKKSRRSNSRLIYPSVNVNYLGYGVFYYKNTHRDNTFGADIERYWTKWKTYSGVSYIGYRLGFVYGYCQKNSGYKGTYAACSYRDHLSTIRQRPKRVFPMGFIFYTYRRKGLGIFIATNVVINTLSLVLYL